MLNSEDIKRSFIIKVKTVPGSSKDSIQLREEGSLTIHVSAPPEKGKANNKLVGLISKWIGISKNEVMIVKGETSREKLIQLPTKYQKVFMAKLEELKEKKEWRK